MKYRSNFLKAKDVADWLDVSESAIYKWVNEETYEAIQVWQRGRPRC